MTSPRRTDLEVVELRTDVGRWPAGTVGTVIGLGDAAALIEIADNRGHGIDFVSVPYEALASAEAAATRAAS